MQYFKIFTDVADGGVIKPDRNEVLRYMQSRNIEDVRILSEVDSCILQSVEKITPKAAYMFLPVTVKDTQVDFGLIKTNSAGLARILRDSKECVLFLATIGTETDRLIAKYSKIQPHKALIYQAIGAELIEKYCDYLEKSIASNFKIGLKMRYSPGYSDFDISVQKEIISVLKAEKYCGITLTQNYLMQPSKSVTAICPITDTKCEKSENKCSDCENFDCIYRNE